MADRNLDDAEALAQPGPSWALALWLSDTLRSAGADPARWAEVVIADSVAFEAGLDPFVAPATTADRLRASLDRLAALAEGASSPG